MYYASWKRIELYRSTATLFAVTWDNQDPTPRNLENMETLSGPGSVTSHLSSSEHDPATLSRFPSLQSLSRSLSFTPFSVFGRAIVYCFWSESFRQNDIPYYESMTIVTSITSPKLHIESLTVSRMLADVFWEVFFQSLYWLRSVDRIVSLWIFFFCIYMYLFRASASKDSSINKLNTWIYTPPSLTNWPQRYWRNLVHVIST